MISRKNKLLAILLSAVLFVGTAFIGVAAAPKGVKISKITVAKTGKSAKVTFKKVKGAKKYQIRYGYKKNLKVAKTKTVKKTSVTLKKLKAGKTLYVKVRAKLKKGYTKYGAVKKVKLSVVQAPTTLAPTTPAPTKPISLKYSIYEMDSIKDSTRLIGRCGYSDDGKSIICDWTTSGFEVGMLCRDDVTVNFKIEGQAGLIGIVIDENFDNMLKYEFKSTDTSATFDTNIPYGVHKIRVVKLNECDGGTNTVVFKGIELKGIPDVKPKEKHLQFEVYGDSITCGYGNLCPDRNLGGKVFGYCQDGSKTYIARLAQKVKADLNVVARSGCGLEHGYGSSENVMSSLWDKALPRYNPAQTWDFSTYTPDIVFINIGTNDTSMHKNGTYSTTRAKVKESALALLRNIRAKYPSCKIVWLEGMMGEYTYQYSKGIDDAIAEVGNAWHLTDLPVGNNGGDWHPNVKEHENICDALYDQLTYKNIL